MADKETISTMIEDFAREIISEASGPGVVLSTKLEAFKTVTQYFVSAVKVGAGPESNKPKPRGFGEMKSAVKEV